MNDPIKISANAILRLKVLLATEPKGSALRISVLGGGCSGFQYAFTFDKKKKEDVAITAESVTVIIDDASIPFVSGSELDFEEDLSSSKFVLKNPNAATSCGCGNSFSL